jgi:protein-S-isoprenylcysteine O-methyltransferase Ste14
MSTQPAAQAYVRRSFWSRWRLRLTTLGLLALPFIRWQWGSPGMAQWSYPVGALVTVIGVLLRLWAAGWLRKNQAMITGGPYAHTRNPLYLGTGVLALGHGLMSAVPLAPLLFTALCFAIYHPAMREEEAYLAQQYGDDFETYRAGVPLWLPRLRPYAAAINQESGFSWQQVRRNREYEAAIINAVLIAVYGWLHQAK